MAAYFAKYGWIADRLSDLRRFTLLPVVASSQTLPNPPIDPTTMN